MRSRGRGEVGEEEGWGKAVAPKLWRVGIHSDPTALGRGEKAFLFQCCVRRAYKGGAAMRVA